MVCLAFLPPSALGRHVASCLTGSTARNAIPSSGPHALLKSSKEMLHFCSDLAANARHR
jgi:hypothetical protein